MRRKAGKGKAKERHEKALDLKASGITMKVASLNSRIPGRGWIEKLNIKNLDAFI
jgi:hypothetical protein